MQPVKNIFPRPIRPFRVQRKRRMMTAAAVGLLLVSLICLAFDHVYWSLVALTASSVLGIALQFATRNLSNSTDLITDERERKLRDHAHRIAYWVMAGVLGGIVGGIMGYFSTRSATTPVLVVADLSKLETLLLLAVFTGVFMGLPTWIIAWLEPDSLEEDNT
jgi:MFS family permease